MSANESIQVDTGQRFTRFVAERVRGPATCCRSFVALVYAGQRRSNPIGVPRGDLSIGSKKQEDQAVGEPGENSEKLPVDEKLMRDADGGRVERLDQPVCRTRDAGRGSWSRPRSAPFILPVATQDFRDVFASRTQTFYYFATLRRSSTP